MSIGALQTGGANRPASPRIPRSPRQPMPAAPIPPDDARRLSSLLSCGILDTAPDPAFDDLTALAAELLRAPICLVSLVAESRQWFKSRVGLDAVQTPRDQAFCGYAILGDETFVIEDALIDERTRDNPLVTGEPGIRFYAGHPMVLEDGSRVGTLCVIDREPRSLGDRDRRLLRRLAGQAAQLVEFSRAKARAERDENEARVLRQALNEHTLFSISDRTGRIIDVNDGFCRISGYTREELLGQDHRMLNSGHHPKAFWIDMWRTIASGRHWRGEVCNRRKDGSLYWVDSTNVPQLDASGRVARYISLRFDITKQKELFESLQESQRVARLGNWSHDFRSDKSQWSRQMYELLGRDPTLGPPDFDGVVACFDDESGQRLRDAVTRAANDGTPYTVTLTARDQRNGVRFIRGEGRVLCDRDGQFIGLFGTAMDITDQIEHERRLERALADAEAAAAALSELQDRFERAIGATSDGLWDFFPATGEVWFSDQFKRLIGLSEDEFDHFPPHVDSFLERLHPDDLERVRQAIADHLEADAPYDIEYRLRTWQGEYRWFRARGDSVRDERSASPRMSGSISDIHAHRNAQTRLDLATRAGGIAMWDWDLETNATHFNELYFTTLGYAPDELPHSVETWEQLLHPDDREAAFADVQRHLRGETRVYANEHRLRCKDGSYRWTRATGELVERSEDGSPKRMIGISVEIQRLRAAVEQARAASKAKSEFVANTSHEIRTPMTAILGYADLLAGSLIDEPDNAMEAVRTIHSNASHLLTVISDILDVSKIEAGKMRIELVATSPVEEICQVVDTVGPRARAKGLELRVQFDSPIPHHICCDPTRLRQILLNLLGNAIKFTSAGSILLRAAHLESDGLMRFCVEDTGVGMSPDQLEIIRRFEAFTQADASTTRQHGGTGLGLRISSALAGMLGGSLEVDSSLGVGSRFAVTVATGMLDDCALISQEQAEQRIRGGQAQRPLARRVDARPLEGLRILLAEDGPDNQRLISFLLSKAGADVTICENGEVAADTIARARPHELPDLVLMDMQMPVLDGYDTTVRLRADGHGMPIIALTAHAMDGDEARCLAAGCNAYLAKPIDRQTLIDVCALWTDRRAA